MSNEKAIKSLKNEFNALLIKHNRAASFLDDNNVPMVDREQHIPAFQGLISEMETLIQALKNAGYAATQEEILYGFKEGK